MLVYFDHDSTDSMVFMLFSMRSAMTRGSKANFSSNVPKAPLVPFQMWGLGPAKPPYDLPCFTGPT